MNRPPLRVVPEIINVSLLTPSTTYMTPPSLVTNLTAEAKSAALAGVRAVLTEDNTDRIIEMLEARIASKLPWYARWMPLGVILDRMLPETLLRVFEDFLA